MPRQADIQAPASTGTSAQDEVFVRAIDLPTLSLRQARAAVAQQLDILSPLPPAETATSVVLIGPSEDGLHRYAAGFAPRRRIADAPGDARTVTLIGRLEGQVIAFRFERPGAVGSLASRLEIATVAAACLAVVLAGANVRVDREIDAAQARVDAVNAEVQQRGHEVAGIARVAGAWRAAAATRKAGVVDCALASLAKASAGPVQVSGLALAGGELTVRLAEPPGDAAVAALKALGLVPSTAVAAAADPADASAPAPAVAPLTFRTSAAACR